MTYAAGGQPGPGGSPDVGELLAGTAERDLHALFGQSTAVFASLAGPAHVVEVANAAFFTAIGGDARTRTGCPWHS